jgi:hypothetical protein
MVQNCKVFPTDLTQKESALDQLFTKIRQNNNTSSNTSVY